MTPHPAPEVVSRIVAAARQIFGEGYRSTYLWGSHARGDAIETSDVDVGVFVRGAIPPEECRHAQHEIESSIGDPRLDLAIVRDAELLGRDAVSFHHGARRIDGDDLRDAVALPSREEWIDFADEAALWWVCRSRPRPFDPDVRPFDEDEFLGYVRDGETKRPLSIAGRIATAGVARASGRFVGDRPQAIEAFVDDVGGAWAPFLVELQESLRVRWRYRIPAEPSEREALRGLCRRMLRFEREFIAGLVQGPRGPRTDKLWVEVS